VTLQGRTVAVLLAAQDYEAMRVRLCKIAANRLQGTLADNAAKAGLTEAQRNLYSIAIKWLSIHAIVHI
jgi:PHD/YefM family antitoxin component YafN of YafNO toxin-antitoxin module